MNAFFTFGPSILRPNPTCACFWTWLPFEEFPAATVAQRACRWQKVLGEVPQISCSVHGGPWLDLVYLIAEKMVLNSKKWYLIKAVHTKNPEVLSNRHRKRTVKLRSSIWQLSGKRTSWSPMLADSGGRKEFHMSCRCNSSLSSEWTNSYTDWWTISDCKKQRSY